MLIFVILCIITIGDNMNYNDKTEVLNFDDVIIRPNKKDKKVFLLRVLPMLLIPILFVLTIISTHSLRLVIIPINYVIYVLLSLFIYLFILGLFTIKKKKNKLTKKKKMRKILCIIFVSIYVICCSIGLFLLYGPYDNFRSWFISTSMSTMSHQYICKWFYSDEEIATVLSKNYIIEINEETDTSLIDMEKEEYKNEYEKQILDRKKGQDYKIIKLEVNGQRAYLAAIYDPSKVKVAVSSNVGKTGQYATKMASDNKAILAVNGGGFANAPGDTTGGRPTGVTISNGKVITDNTYSSDAQSGGLIGMTTDNKLVLIKNATASKAKQMNVRDGVSWGPFLIVNGKKSFIKGNGGWGYAARTAIGQRQDGIILLLVVDSNSTRTKGASMTDLTEIMSNYGAVNAANLDGGTSSVMVLPKKEALEYINSCDKDYCYINDPVDSSLKHKTRGIASTVIVTK